MFHYWPILVVTSSIRPRRRYCSKIGHFLWNLGIRLWSPFCHIWRNCHCMKYCNESQHMRTIFTHTYQRHSTRQGIHFIHRWILYTFSKSVKLPKFNEYENHCSKNKSVQNGLKRYYLNRYSQLTVCILRKTMVAPKKNPYGRRCRENCKVLHLSRVPR